MSTLTATAIDRPANKALTADDYFRAQNDRLYRRTDILFAVLLFAEWLGCCLWTFYFSPLTYNGLQSSVHPHVTAALFFGGLITLFPCFLVINAPSNWLTRHTIAVAQALMSSLIIHVSGGRIESHFHIFGSLAFLAFYRDWTVIITATVIIAADHFFRGIYYPQSVYGIATSSISRTFEHATWVIFEDIFLIYSCLYSRKEMREIAVHRAEQAQTNARIEQEVELRTEELNHLTEVLKHNNLDLENKNKEIEAERQAALDANRAKSEFLTNMSHELRTPLTAILGYAEIISEPEDPEVVQEAAQTIQRNGSHLLALLNDILDLSKMDAHKLHVQFEPVSPTQTLRAVNDLLKVRADEKRIGLVTSFQHPIPEYIVSDDMRLKQILINLVGNAIKFTDKGEVSIFVHSDEFENRLYFDIVDTGIGIAPENQHKLFNEFEQADNSLTRKYGGTGLGLTIVQRLARLLHGDAYLLKSTPHIGSTFRLELPLTLPNQKPALQPHAPTQELVAV